MYNDTIKLLNLKQFKLKIKKLDTIKYNNTIYCYITLENQKDKCPVYNNFSYIKESVNKKIKHSISNNNPYFIFLRLKDFTVKFVNKLIMRKILFVINKIINYSFKIQKNINILFI